MITIDAEPSLVNKRLQDLYNAMKEKKFTDVVFVVGDQKFFAHMSVLSACSKFFENDTECISEILSNFDDSVIDAMFKYCYLGEIHIEKEHYDKFLELTDKLEIKEIPSRFETIDESNCLEILDFTDDSLTKENAKSLILDNFNTLYKSPEFLKLPASTIIDILKSDELNATDEDKFNSIKLWIKFDEENRKSKLIDLLNLVDFQSLSIEFIITEFMDLCYPNSEYNAIFKQAIFKNCQSKLSTAEHILKNCVSELSSVGKQIKNSRTKLSIFEENLNDYQNIFESKETMNVKLAIVGDYEPNFDYIDLKDGHKYQLKPLHQSRQWPSAAVICKNSTIDIYAIGGIDSYESRNFLSSVERWSNNTKTWDTDVAPLLHAVYFHSAGVINNIIYVTGGRIKKDGEDIATNMVQVYSVKTNSWSYGTPMISKRIQHSSVVFKGRLFVGGGTTDETYDYLDSVESYDPIADMWTVYCTLPQPVRALSLCFYRNKLLCLAGHDGQNYLTNVWEYDDTFKDWKALKSLNKGRHYATAHVIPYDSII